jgi:hypothetical protein
MVAPHHSPRGAKTVELPRRTQGSFTRCFCGPNPSASTSTSSIQMHYKPFCSGSKVWERRKTRSRLARGTPSDLTNRVRDDHVSAFNSGLSKLSP